MIRKRKPYIIKLTSGEILRALPEVRYFGGVFDVYYYAEDGNIYFSQDIISVTAPEDG